MDNIREAFNKVKDDISSLRRDLEILNFGVEETQKSIEEIRQGVSVLKSEFMELSTQANSSTKQSDNKTDSQNSSTYLSSFRPLNSEILDISTGNKGVKTDRQTDRQTDISAQNPSEMLSQSPIEHNPKKTIESAAELLSSLDSIKKEIRLQFKRLTRREWLVFSTIYQLDEEKGYSDYKSISERLNLTESSIRDYVARLINKGIPIDKTKINNKTIHLGISKGLKQVATLSTILKLRDL